MLIEVDVDEQDVINQMTDRDLEEELAKRRARKVGARIAAEPAVALGLAEDLRTAFYARNASRFEQLLCQLDKGAVLPLKKDPIAHMPGARH